MILREPWLGPNYLLMIAVFFFKSLYENPQNNAFCLFCRQIFTRGSLALGCYLEELHVVSSGIVFIYFIIFFLSFNFFFFGHVAQLGVS